MYGICDLSIVALRLEPSENSEMINQILFGEHFKVLEKDKNWSRIQLEFDNFEGYIDNKQYKQIPTETYISLSKTLPILNNELIDFIKNDQGFLTTIPLGAHLPNFTEGRLTINKTNYFFEGKTSYKINTKISIIETAFSFLNTPHLLGGKSPFGIDSDGFTQIVYKINGYKIPRTLNDQSKHGEVLSFIEESEPGDLAFFDDENGEINHVGIIMGNYNIIHVFGKVRIDKLDHTGIYNTDTKTHTHKLRVLKKII